MSEKYLEERTQLEKLMLHVGRTSTQTLAFRMTACTASCSGAAAFTFIHKIKARFMSDSVKKYFSSRERDNLSVLLTTHCCSSC